MDNNLTLVTLTAEQIARAKEVNGARKRITHALICGPYGQIFGTEKQCLKYFKAWNPAARPVKKTHGADEAMFPGLFDKGVKTKRYEITDYTSTPAMGEKLFDAFEKRPRRAKRPRIERPDVRSATTTTRPQKRKGVFGRLFS